ncbi:MAG: hypothetical protein P8Y63_00510 [Deltaproteobacteria bacterium]
MIGTTADHDHKPPAALVAPGAAGSLLAALLRGRSCYLPEVVQV